MISTFMGLETSKRGLQTSQSALYTTGHNVANANTPGYTRQRLNLNPTTAFPSPGLNSPSVPGQLGTGVEAGALQRIRDSFLDTQYRSQNSQVGYYASQSESLTKMEEIMNDPTESGLLSTMNSFWTSLEDLTKNTNSTSARSVVASSGEMVADTLNYYHTSLTNVQKDLHYQIGVKAQEVNTIISNIHDINKSISKIEPNGFIPNDLYDTRDLLVDELSNLVNVRVNSVIPIEYGIADRAVAEGLYNVDLILEDGTSVNLVSADNTGVQGMSEVQVGWDITTGVVSGVTVGGAPLSNYKFSGELAGLIESAGYMEGTAIKGVYPDMLQKLNNLTEAFVNEFNRIHRQGYALDDKGIALDNADPTKLQPSKPIDFFEIELGKDASAGIKVNTAILTNASLIAAAGQPGGSAGDNENAHKLSVIKLKDFKLYGVDKSTDIPTTLPVSLKGSFDGYYAGLIGNLGVDSASAQRNEKNAQALTDSVDQNRQSVSSVSLDEEMTDMIKYQQSYNASARMITVINELLDKLINNM